MNAVNYQYNNENVFAKIIRGEIPNQTVLDTKYTLAFKDINPVAPNHVLVIPKGPYVNFDHFVSDASSEEILDFNKVINQVIIKMKVSPGGDGQGYRIISNAGKHGFQEVPHLHFHIVSGRFLGPMILKSQ